MKNKIKLMILGLTLVALVGMLVLLFPAAAHMETKTDSKIREVVNLSSMDCPTNPAADDEEWGNPAVESVLNRLVKIYHSEGPEAAAEFASRREIPFDGEQLMVILDADISFLPGAPAASSDKVSADIRELTINHAVSLVKAGIERLGGRVERTYRYLVQCSIGIRRLNELARIPGVRSIRRPLKPVLHTISEGVQKTGAHLYHDLAAFKSTGAKVMVLDVDFEGYSDLLGSELPESVTTRSFYGSNGDDPIHYRTDRPHGTGCAEIIYDMAPDAELYLAGIESNTDAIDAVQWAVEQEIDIISFSLGSYFGAGDGTGLLGSLAKWAYQTGGIIWVTAAGNAADGHWSGTFNDPDGDGWHNFCGDDELLNFHFSSEGGPKVYLKWNDWGTWDDYYGYSGSDQDFDLYLFVWVDRDKSWSLCCGSISRQPDFKWPWEDLFGFVCEPDDIFGVAIRKVQASKNVFFDLYIFDHSPGTLEYQVPEGSLSSPADSPYTIGVGAVDAVGDYYHFYSSQGPTADGRIKPDICAPSAVSTSDISYGLRSVTGGFIGTSASCAHVAGAIALLKGKTPFSLEKIKSILYSRAIDMGEPGMDNIFGWGRLNLHR